MERAAYLAPPNLEHGRIEMITPRAAKRDRQFHLFMLTTLGLALLVSAVAWACDTPVYRYAMYNWTPESYVVVYAYDGEQDALDTAANEQLAEATTSDTPANIRFMMIDVSDPDDLQRLPTEARDALDVTSDLPLPYHVVISPHNDVLLKKRLTVEAVHQLLDSPARTELADLLRQGRAGVLILLESENPTANTQALSEAKAAIARAAAGEILPYTLDGTTEPNPEKDAFQVGLIVVSRKAPAEQAMVSMLLDVEEDLFQYTEPMIFGVYGRGRAGWPYLGKGITTENINDCLAFMSGACSCEVKEQNPGMDILVSADWNAAAESLVVQFQDDSADEYLQAEALFPVVMNTLDEQVQGESKNGEQHSPASIKQSPSTAAVADETVANKTVANETVAKNLSLESDNDSTIEFSNSPLSRSLFVVVGGMVVVVMLSSLLVLRHRGS